MSPFFPSPTLACTWYVVYKPKHSYTACLFDAYIAAAIGVFFFQEYEPLSGKHEVVYRGDDPWEVRREGGGVFVLCAGAAGL